MDMLANAISSASRHCAEVARPRVRFAIARGLLALSLTIALLVALGVGAGVASAVSPIERIWSFNGGEVAIQAQPSGTFVGTVVQPTKFALCTHPVGEPMWTEMTRQPDGSYWGRHRWFYETSGCVPNETLGPTAWRVMEAASGSTYLLVCFSSPGGPQPRIAPDGSSVNVSYGCVRSAEVAAVSAVQSFAHGVSLPSNRKCFSHRLFQIHLHESAHDPFKEVVVTLAKRRIAVKRRGNVFAATINLKGLPRGAFTVRIHVTTVLGHRLSGSRTYHTCARMPSKPKRRARTGHHGHP
jgi:hypothetical protein